MQYYFAPLEGTTGYILRNAHAHWFRPADKYFTPFLSPNQNRCFLSKERNDVLPEHNQGIMLVPQLLTNKGEYFIWAARELAAMGYQELNLNLGCPSGTVVAKKKGAGFLTEHTELIRFLDEVFCTLDLKISIKTRLGRYDEEEFEELLEIFNCYPLEELIIHPRIQKQFYKGEPNRALFAQAMPQSRAAVCYNGDLFSAAQVRAFEGAHPAVERIMLGRGLLTNPAMLEELTGEGRLDAARLRGFHDEVYQNYSAVMPGDHAILARMKELWSFLMAAFDNGRDFVKPLRKTKTCGEYESVVSRIFQEGALSDSPTYCLL